MATCCTPLAVRMGKADMYPKTQKLCRSYKGRALQVRPLYRQNQGPQAFWCTEPIIVAPPAPPTTPYPYGPVNTIGQDVNVGYPSAQHSDRPGTIGAETPFHSVWPQTFGPNSPQCPAIIRMLQVCSSQASKEHSSVLRSRSERSWRGRCCRHFLQANRSDLLSI